MSRIAPKLITTVAALIPLGLYSIAAQEQHPLQKELKDTEVKGQWHYNDFAAGVAESKRTGKPLLVVFR